MFTGIIQAVGTILEMENRGADRRAGIDPGAMDIGDMKVGDSICVNGVCLTASTIVQRQLWLDISAETLSCTTLGTLDEGAPVNLEKALRMGDPLGGHMVSGHVDGVGCVIGREGEGRSVRFVMEAPPELGRYIARKGSVCIDGVSMTVNGVDGVRFSVNVVPHTLVHTIFPAYVPGSRINIEVDLLARYLERLLEAPA